LNSSPTDQSKVVRICVVVLLLLGLFSGRQYFAHLLFGTQVPVAVQLDRLRRQADDPDRDRVRAALDAMVLEHGDEPEVLEVAARMFETWNELDRCEELLRRGMELPLPDRATEQRGRRPRATLSHRLSFTIDLADLLVRRHQGTAALELYRTCLDSRDVGPRAAAAAATLLLAEGRPDDAAAIMTACERTHGETTDTALVLAQAARASGDAAAALERAQRAVSLRRSNGEATLLVAQLLYEAGRKDEASVARDRARLLLPDDARVAALGPGKTR